MYIKINKIMFSRNFSFDHLQMNSNFAFNPRKRPLTENDAMSKKKKRRKEKEKKGTRISFDTHA